MLIYAFYENLTKSHKILFTKCHMIHNTLYKEAYKLLSIKLGPIYGTLHLSLHYGLDLDLISLPPGYKNMLTTRVQNKCCFYFQTFKMLMYCIYNNYALI